MRENKNIKSTKNIKDEDKKVFLYVDSDTTKAYGDEIDICSLLSTALFEFVDAGEISIKHARILLAYLSEELTDIEEKRKSKIVH